MMFEFAEEAERLAVIKVAGIGGAGGNAVGRMIEANLTGVEFLAVNTDLQALKESPAHNPLQIGAQLTKGLGSGGNPAVGQAAAEEDRKTIAAAVAGEDMVFVTAGMGGGTGTGAAAVVADIARDEGALTVGIVTRPFQFEGQVRGQQAEEGIRRLQKAVDTLIVIPNQRLLEVVPPNTSMQDAFRIADNVLYEATRGIYEIITRHDHVNLDFADVRSVMKDMGVAIMGTGRAEGENRAVEAAKAAISSPLLEDVEIAGSKAVLVNVLGREVELHDTAAAMQYIQDARRAPGARHLRLRPRRQPRRHVAGDRDRHRFPRCGFHRLRQRPGSDASRPNRLRSRRPNRSANQLPKHPSSRWTSRLPIRPGRTRRRPRTTTCCPSPTIRCRRFRRGSPNRSLPRKRPGTRLLRPNRLRISNRRSPRPLWPIALPKRSSRSPSRRAGSS